MTTVLPILMAAVISGWAFLSLLGGERTRRAREAEAEAEAKKAAEAKAAKAGGANSAGAQLPMLTVGAAAKPTPPAAAPAKKPAPRKS